MMRKTPTYDRNYDPVWHFIIKEILIGGAGVLIDDDRFVVIAAIYCMIYPPQSLRLISKAWSEHIDPNVQVTEEEARELFDMHAEVWEFTNWKTFCCGTLIQISKFSGVQHSFHIGVVMAGIPYGCWLLTYESILVKPLMRRRHLRHHSARKSSLNFLIDAFGYPIISPSITRTASWILDVVIMDGDDNVGSNDPLPAPFLRAGLLTREGKFACIAANWYCTTTANAFPIES